MTIPSDRSKRFIVVGALATLYAIGWLFFAWRASRIGESTCTLDSLPGGAYCTVFHRLDGVRYELPGESCSGSSRWPRGVGLQFPCSYYLNAPDDIFFERREHRWLTPIPVVVLALALGMLGYGIGGRFQRAPSPPAVDRDPYRAAYRPSPPEPFRLALSERHWSRWLVAGPFLVLGLVLAGLVAYLEWTRGGQLGAMDLVLLVIAHGVTLAGAFGLFFRSGLVLDPGRGLCVHWWGLLEPWFHRYWSLDALTHATHERSGAGRSTTHFLVLHFADGRARRFSRASDAEASVMASRIGAYLNTIREPTES